MQERQGGIGGDARRWMPAPHVGLAVGWRLKQTDHMAQDNDKAWGDDN